MGWFFSSSSFDTGKSSRCFYDNLKGKCASCKNMNPDSYTSSLFSGYKYKCEEVGSYYSWDDRTCRRLDEVNPGIVDCVERYYKFTGKRYFILTAIFEILGIDLNSRLYTEISSLIDLVREDSTTEAEAIEYDIVGMNIANCLRKDRNNIEICNDLLENYIVKIYSLIGLNNTNEAIKLYKEMVKKLFIRYNNKENYSQIIDIEPLKKSKIIVKK